MKLTSFLWLTPFILFCLGYGILAYRYPARVVEVPSIVGMTLEHALPVLSAGNLNIRILAYKQDAELHEGTIVSQTPAPQACIKFNQAIYVVLSHKPQALAMPALSGKSLGELTSVLNEHDIRGKVYTVSTRSKGAGQCIGHYPHAGTPLESKKAVIYVAHGQQKPVLLPNFKHKSIIKVVDFLDQQSIDYSVSQSGFCRPGHRCTDACLVIDQRPLAYSLVLPGIDSLLHVYLRVRHEL
jgi:beta-lactam-binding protein with PASTA domain